jgi:hypothetical protein
MAAELERAEDDGRPEVTPGFTPTLERPIPLVRCTSMTRASGMTERCKRWALMGSDKCPKHIGFGHLATVQEARQRVIERGRARLVLGSEDAIDTLLELVKDAPAAVRLKAATEVLDRVGITAKQEVEVNVTHTVDDTAQVVRERLERIASRVNPGEGEVLELTEGPDGTYEAAAPDREAVTATVNAALADIPLATLDTLKYRKGDRVLVTTVPDVVHVVTDGPDRNGYFRVRPETGGAQKWRSARSLRDLPAGA